MDITLAKYLNKWQEIKLQTRNFITEFWSYPSFRVYAIILGLTMLANWSASFYTDYKIKDAQVALHYNVDFGIDYYGDIKQIYIIPLLGTFVILLNFCILAIISRHKDRLFIANLLLLGSELANIILLVALISIYLINA